MNIRLLAKYWRTILIVAEMNMRQTMTDGFVLFTVLFQPILIALLGLWMLQDKVADAAMYVVVGSGLTGLWSSLLFISGNSINFERWMGTLESMVAIPTPFEVIVVGKEPCQCRAIFAFDGVGLFRSRVCFWIFFRNSTTVALCGHCVVFGVGVR